MFTNKGSKMSNIYLDNNRIIKMKDIDQEFEKIGTFREGISSKELIALILSILLLSGVLVGGIYYKTRCKQKIKNNNIEMSVYDAIQHESR